MEIEIPQAIDSAEDCKGSDSTKNDVYTYLLEIFGASNKLVEVRDKCDDKNVDMELENDANTKVHIPESADDFIPAIASNLLKACNPSVLASDVNHLPEMNILSFDENMEFDDEFPSEETLSFYQHRRSDYLRRLLRVMAPISMEVSASVCSAVVSAVRNGSSSEGISQIELSAVVLFGHWLPVAPHLSPMATEMFTSVPNPWDHIDQEHGYSYESSQSQLFQVTEALYQLCSFFSSRGEISFFRRSTWEWAFVFSMLQNKEDVVMEDFSQANSSFSFPEALNWFSVRILSLLMEWNATITRNVLKLQNVDRDRVPWRMHPWEYDQEEVDMEQIYIQRQVFLWGHCDSFRLPSSKDIQAQLEVSPYLAIVGPGISIYKQGSLRSCSVKDTSSAQEGRKNASEYGFLVPTATTNRNLALLGAAMCEDPHPPPILVCGPHGSGKSSLIRELLRLCRPKETLIEFHIDEETDSKTLIGSYTTTDIPGEFSWRAGALTNASREGRWVLIEDLDTIPLEIQAALAKLFEERMIPLGNGKYERCHPNFRIFATCTTTVSSSVNGNERQNLRIGNHRGGGKQILNSSYWRNVHVKPMPYSELKEVAQALFPDIPVSVTDSAMTLLETFDRSGRDDNTDASNIDEKDDDDDDELQRNTARLRTQWMGGRVPSVRDLFKLLSRISNGVCFERDVSYTTEAQRTLCMAESVDVLLGSSPSEEIKNEFIGLIAAPVWGISRTLGLKYMRERKPTVLLAESFFEIGRARFNITKSMGFTQESTDTFAETSHALRLMESIAVCVRENEPILLVGETGCGKTTNIQQLAARCGRTLVVQNLSLQTDSTDLLGGYRPLEIQNVARNVYKDFVDTFVSSFSRKQNLQFLQYAASMLEKSNWKKLSQSFKRAAQLGLKKMEERKKKDPLFTEATLESWQNFAKKAERFERQRVSCDAGLAFEFAEGALVDAIQNGKWVLLDEINLASSDTLQRLCGLLDEPTGSLTLTERGDATAIKRHPNFRLFAAMNPATDAGKKDLPLSIRCRFSELYVSELLDPLELRLVAAQCLHGIIPSDGNAPEHTEIIACIVDQYLKCRELALSTLSDGNGHKPRYTLRTLSRALKAAKNLVLYQRIRLKVAVYEGFQQSFEGTLDTGSIKVLRKMLKKAFLGEESKRIDLEHPGRRPGKTENEFVLVKPFWIKSGPIETVDWSETGPNGKSKFILTKTASTNLRRLARALATGPWPILLEGPTSSGKTTLVEYIAARCGHPVVRINNHEHTDVQEYTGAFAADQNGSLSFRDGILVQALRKGHWVILDELNLAPSEVLEALNRLLDDNRELYLAETNEIVKPHPNFRLFATQNPSGAYGGRKPLSRAFRNRFVELYVGDIPSDEMTTILEKRCGCPPTHAKLLVKIMVDLRLKRSKSNLFLGKDSFITPRDLLRWAERHSGSRKDLAEHGYMVLAERLRSNEEKQMVLEVLEEHTKVKFNLDELYYGSNSEARKILNKALTAARLQNNHLVASIAPTRSILRLIHIVSTCIRQKEPVLLVGDTGCGKTTVIQLLSFVLNQTLYSVNCHATTETSDLIGGLRPVRGRERIKEQILLKLKELIEKWPYKDMLDDLDLQQYIMSSNSSKQSNSTTNQSLHDVDTMVSVAQAIVSRRPNDVDQQSVEMHTSKRRKVSDSNMSRNYNSDCSDDISVHEIETLSIIAEEIEELGRNSKALFEWSDGPLVKAMKGGQLMLLDEMSLAEDAVLERLNSVLEPSRLLVLAEKGDDGSFEKDRDDRIIVAHNDFRIFATMNPGGDYGKRELSPALRSRFTEIWVPSISARSDFEIVLGRSLSLNLGKDTNFDPDSIVCRILDYLDWFNFEVCGAPSSPYSDFSLSLRDVLSWINFISEAKRTNPNLTMRDALYHGACLMHLDGLGLGSGLDSGASDIVKKKAQDKLSSLIDDGTISNATSVDGQICIRDRKFGVFPYFIDIGPSSIPKSNFDMTAPTTSLNAFRVLRAMQLKKPILLEGSPGVGKTSLISALASASGNKLVRINLSDQTDVSDLMGSDLPVENSAGGGPSFEWCDGVLLTAIKEGSWVLLDELNLASQAVLEGLNSCLDHRATMYIPELGKTFNCPSSFRIFAAQNPLGQGGGRKGLPKSFLNRFTKVYIDALTNSDLRSIVFSRFSSFPEKLVNQIIDFNNEVHHEVVDLRKYGSDGSPWEFNLRDVFRWCELIESGHSAPESGARDLYYQRFRTQEDRKKVNESFQKHFGYSLISNDFPKLKVLPSSVHIGETNLTRMTQWKQTRPMTPTIRESELLFGRLVPMEAVARCINLKWPCLLVGGSGAGKTSIVSILAGLCNATLVEHCLSPSSDVSELVGGFEQSETLAIELRILEEVCILAKNTMMADAFKSEHSVSCWNLVEQLQKYLDMSLIRSLSSEDRIPWKNINTLIEILSSMVRKDPRLSSFVSGVENVEKMVKEQTERRKLSKQNQGSSHFIWRDGILVEALEKGYWLLLENANLCPASVLDRLNSVTERNGFLLLSESGVKEGGDGAHRIIRPHENFRIFFTMNAANGEISRAMRNRCVEISLLEPASPETFQTQETDSESSEASHKMNIVTNSLCMFPRVRVVDLLSITRGARIRSFEVASWIIAAFINESKISSASFGELPLMRIVFGSVNVLSGLLSRGLDRHISAQLFLQLSFEIEESVALEDYLERLVHVSTGKRLTPLPDKLSLNSIRNECTPMTTMLEARFLRVFAGKDSNVKEILSDLGILRLSKSSVGSETLSFSELRGMLSQIFLHSRSLGAIKERNSLLGGLKSPVSSMVHWMSSALEAIVTGCNDSTRSNNNVDLLNISWRRLQQRFVEKCYIGILAGRNTVIDSPEGLTVLEASYYVHENLLEGASVSCSVTALLYRFFNAVDIWVNNVITSRDENILLHVLPHLDSILGERDNLWNVLKHLPLDLDAPNGNFAFNESEFIVQWQWLQKKFPKPIFRKWIVEGWQLVDMLTSAIDNAIYGGPRHIWSTQNVRKKIITPLVPRRSKHWETFDSLLALSKSSSLQEDNNFDPFRRHGPPLTIQQLLTSSHPSLYTDTEVRTRLLAAICTSQLSWLAKHSGKTEWVDKIDFASKMSESITKLKDEFEIAVASARVDLDIQTVENQIESSALDEFKDCSDTTLSRINAYCNLKTKLLTYFANLQVTALAEFWCVCQERYLCGEISKLLLVSKSEKGLREGLLHLKSSMNALVETALSKTIWAVGDMRTFQLLIWQLDGDSPENRSLEILVRSLLPTMLLCHSKHASSGSFVCRSSISSTLEMPDMWTTDFYQQGDHRQDNYDVIEEKFVIGSARLRQQVRTEILLEMYGSQLSFNTRPSDAKFYTIENAVYRENQSKEILNLLSASTIPSTNSRLFMYHFILLDILTAVDSVFKDQAIGPILSLVKSFRAMKESNYERICALGKNVHNDFFDLFWGDLVLPLLVSLNLAWVHEVGSFQYEVHCSRACIFLGLLRLNLVTPCTPLDPGTAPIAKVSLITRQLSEIQCRLTATRLNSGFVSGNFIPVSDETKFLIQKTDILTRKRTSQQKKVIERIDTAPPFAELFRATSEFLTTTATTRNVKEIMNYSSPTLTKSNSEYAKRRVDNWLQTAAAFCRRLSNDFMAYEDIVTSVIDSVRMVQDGLSDTVQQSQTEAEKSNGYIGELFKVLYQYPMHRDSKTIQVLCQGSKIQKLESKPEPFKALSIATLSRFLLKSETVGLDSHELTLCSQLFSELTNAYEDYGDQKEDSNLEEMQERIFREQFPDHRKEFSAVLQDASELGNIENAEEEGNTDSKSHDKTLTDSQIDLLYQIYRGIFSGKKTFHADAIRKISFHSSYIAAHELQKIHGISSSVGSEDIGGHVFAMSLSSIPKEKMSRVHSYFNESIKVDDFHNEACPSIALSASDPLEKLMARTTQLLTAFPGHTILIGLGKVCEKVHKLNIMTTPIGKIMTGLEVILKQAQDWEQHASEKVKIGLPLVAIGRLISEWRKFELESWGNLIQGRHNRHLNRTHKHWLKLRGIFDTGRTKNRDETTSTLMDQQKCLTPKWVWKGLVNPSSRIFHNLDDEDSDNFKNLVKALDTFVLTSSLGEFEGRMRVLKTCADECGLSIRSNCPWSLQRYRALYSTWMYYGQYLPGMIEKLRSHRSPIEDKLKSETKLAKWDTQSYYALAESTEKNHRKLMKILSEFDESLNMNVGVIIQQEGCSGLRSSIEAHDDFSATFPSFASMFPLEGIAKECVFRRKKGEEHEYVLTPVEEKFLNPSKHHHISKIGKYAKKMKSLKAIASKSLLESNVSFGVDVASSFCRGIFDRIESLRANGTRPMKERALVDLFREMKENGFSNTKWSTPSEMKGIEQIFLLPAPELGCHENTNTISEVLNKAEQYYIKCVSEVHSLRSETMMLGSNHMSKREVDNMVNLGYSGLHLLIQQRCLLTANLSDNSNLKEWLSITLAFDDSLPPRQSALKAKLTSLGEKEASAFESVKQLVLFLQSTSTLLFDDRHCNWVRDCTSKLKSLISEVPNYSAKSRGLLSWKVTKDVQKSTSELSEAKKTLLEISRECRNLGCLPLDPFTTTLQRVESAFASAIDCNNHILDSLKHTTSSKMAGTKLILFGEKISSVIERLLVAYQNLSKEAGHGGQAEKVKNSDEQSRSDVAIWDCHKNYLKFYADLNITKLLEDLFHLLREVQDIHSDNFVAEEERKFCVGVVRNTSVLVTYVQNLFESLLHDYLNFYHSTTKLNYVILRLFRTLVAKGFCSDKTNEEEGEGEGDIKGMTFEDDNDGTGMGEGEGKKDVTDQIENEDQLAGLKSDNDKEEDKTNQDESRQLNEEEAEHGMEMEGDFDGEMYDLPENPHDENETEDQEGEELDTEMGDDTNRDDQVVDEKMWNDSDDEEDINKEEEKHEEDSGVKGEAIEDAMRTKDDADEDDSPDDNERDNSTQNQPESNPSGDAEDGEDLQDDKEINEDTEDRYEENHDVDVRGDDNDESQEDVDDSMQLDDNIEIDDNEEGNEDDKEVEEDILEQDEFASASNEEENDESKDDHDSDEEEENESMAKNAQDNMDFENGEKDQPEKEDKGEDDNDKQESDKANNEDSQNEEAHGVRSKDGTDAIIEDEDEADGNEDEAEENETSGNPSDGKSDGNQIEMDGRNGGGYSESQINDGNETKSKNSNHEIPNPMKNPGDASKFWHRKLNIIDSSDTPEQNETEQHDTNEKDISEDLGNGDFEYSTDKRESTQVLGEVTEEDAVAMDVDDNSEALKDDNTEDVKENEEKNIEMKQKKNERENSRKKNPQSSTEQKDQPNQNDFDDGGSLLDEIEMVEEESSEGESKNDNSIDDDEGDLDPGSRVMSDLSKLKVDGDTPRVEISQLVQDEYFTHATSSEEDNSRSQWLTIQGQTQNLSRRLCEKLRLVMEPLVASKLRGDYRTGKRINMKRVIGYIASGYRKDKIWLRRTKPAKRNYRVLLAVDDSESMKKSGAGDMALNAMATVAVGMNQLEIGELGVASFGDDMKLVHPFHMPFTSESGVSVVRNFKFDQQRTRIAMCVESAMAALEDAGDQGSMQLVFLISDGRIERDSRSVLRRLIREMMERNILLAMIIVEGKGKKKDSLLNMKEVTFEKGKPIVKRFIDDYPFPYYIVLDDVGSLPEVLGDALKQWFEMLTQLQIT